MLCTGPDSLPQNTPRQAGRKTSPLTFAVALLMLPGLLAACGYQSMMAIPDSPEGAAGEGAATRIALVALRNDSPEPWLDRIVSDALRREFGLRGRFELIADPEQADYVLRGRILPIGLRSNSFSTFVVAIEYKLTLELQLELLRAKGDVIRLPARGLRESEVYLASQDVEVARSNRLEALRHLSDILATRVADSVEWITHSEAVPSPATGEGEAVPEALPDELETLIPDSQGPA